MATLAAMRMHHGALVQALSPLHGKEFDAVVHCRSSLCLGRWSSSFLKRMSSLATRYPSLDLPRLASKIVMISKPCCGSC